MHGHVAPAQVLPNTPHAASVDANAVDPSIGRMIHYRSSFAEGCYQAPEVSR
jgi:hypothetical protein